MNVRSTVRPSAVAPASDLMTRARTGADAIHGLVRRAPGIPFQTRRMLDEYLLYVGDPPAVDGRASLT